MASTKQSTKKPKKIDEHIKIKVDVGSLPVYKEPNSATEVVNLLRREEVYDISATENGFGKLLNGAGWIDLKQTRRV